VNRRPQPRPADQQQAQVLADLAVPVPFAMADFQARLTDYSGYQVQLLPAELPAGAPSGIWIRSNGSDYLYYERETSPFHQAHIVLHLAAHLLINDTSARVLDERLFSQVSKELVQLMLGDTTPSAITGPQADAFAFAALGPACQVSWLAARRALRQLAPLHRALLGAVPAGRSPDLPGAGLRRMLYQVVIEIRDAELALRQYRDPRPLPTEPDLASEVAWLTQDAKALGRCWPGDETGHGQGPPITPDGESRSDT
jgi:hypothetical protein